MNNEFFKNLTDSEYQSLKNAIPEITIYIAGIDGNIDVEEKEWAEKVTEIRSYKMKKELIDFYKDIGSTFHEDLENLIKLLPQNPQERNTILEAKLSQLNPILSKLDPKVASRLYKSYLSFAQHVAKASGGFLGFFAISSKEADILNLSMINPIIFEDEEEE